MRGQSCVGRVRDMHSIQDCASYAGSLKGFEVTLHVCDQSDEAPQRAASPGKSKAGLGRNDRQSAPFPHQCPLHVAQLKAGIFMQSKISPQAPVHRPYSPLYALLSQAPSWTNAWLHVSSSQLSMISAHDPDQSDEVPHSTASFDPSQAVLGTTEAHN